MLQQCGFGAIIEAIIYLQLSTKGRCNILHFCFATFGILIMHYTDMF